MLAKARGGIFMPSMAGVASCRQDNVSLYGRWYDEHDMAEHFHDKKALERSLVYFASSQWSP